MRKLLKYPVATSIELDLVDLDVQAVDLTKIAADVAGDRTYDVNDLQRLLKRTKVAILETESQNGGKDNSALPRLPTEIQKAKEYSKGSKMP